MLIYVKIFCAVFLKITSNYTTNMKLFWRICHEIANVVGLLEQLTLNHNVINSLTIVASAEEPYADNDGSGLRAEVRTTGHDQGPGGWKQVGHGRGRVSTGENGKSLYSNCVILLADDIKFFKL